MIAKRTTLVAALAAAWLTFASTAPAAADDHTAGVESDPVMESQDPEVTGIATPPPPSAQPSDASAAATSSEYSFGAQSLDDVEAAAAAYTRPSGCSISDNGLAAMMLSPTFPETGAGSVATPSPMTLSRWDRDIGLYSMSDRSTYTRAFWHPGVGMWQFDSAGAWGLTAYERMTTAVVAPLAASVMGNRYCNATASGASGASARASAWGPWVACRSGICDEIFWEIYDGASNPLNVESDDAVNRTGGVTASACAPPGLSSRSCRHVDPSVALGHRGWTGTPSGSSSVAPLSLPFDVVEANGLEWRMWSAEDTGFGVDIAASKPLGANARSKPNPARTCERISPITWYRDGVVQDSVDRSSCPGTYPPPGFGQTDLRVNGDYQALAGDFSGDGLDDIVWYGPGGTADHLWRSPIADPTSLQLSISGTYEPLVGDFSGDGIDDIFWYRPGSGAEYVWTGRAGNPANRPFDNHSGAGVRVNGHYDPVVGDFSGDGIDDIFWHAPGSTRHYLWRGGNGLSFQSNAVDLAIDRVDAVGDFDGDGRTDLVDHRPGATPDAIFHSTGTNFVRTTVQVGGSYNLIVGDYDDNGVDDIYWYSTGSGNDYVWFNDPGRRGQPSGAAANLSSGRRWAALDSPNGTDIAWMLAGDAAEEFWTFSGRSLSRSSSLSVEGSYQPVVGRWTAGGDGVFLYAPGSTPDLLWTR
ncbi:MAG: VCBS repeat-containing protein [Acidimicrobiales bacterium]|nr:VCBS repeat-containing protein [Acidimicrobiales bacterium]